MKFVVGSVGSGYALAFSQINKYFTAKDKLAEKSISLTIRLIFIGFLVVFVLPRASEKIPVFLNKKKMEFFKKIFRRKREAQTKPQPLRIEGCKTTLTPKPDEAELAAEALLEMMCDGRRKMEDVKPQPSSISHQPSSPHGAAYYRELSEKIRTARAAERRLTMRYLAYCEEQLALPQPLYVGQIGEMEQELYKRQDVAEREGGELLRRWQHCLAECIVRQMSEASEESWESGGTAVIQQKTEQ